MSENKITKEEMIDWFGPDIPMEAVNLIWGADGEKTLGEIRRELREMGERRKRLPKMDMIERVAKAMWERSHDEPWEESIYSPVARQIYLDDARAAIEAMRSPTEGMVTTADMIDAAMAEQEEGRLRQAKAKGF